MADNHRTNGNGNDTNGSMEASKLLWRHSSPQTTAMYRYLQTVNQSQNLHLSTYPDLYKWSIENINAFWESVWKFVGIRAEGTASPVSKR